MNLIGRNGSRGLASPEEFKKFAGGDGHQETLYFQKEIARLRP